MAIYRGDGGSGDATDDVTVNQIADYVNETLGYKNAAATSATNASTSESNAATSATNAASSATSAAGSATAAASSATAASTSASNASTSETNAATSETNAATSASTASTQATNAATSATNAATSESNAAASASAASTSASTATTQATNAATSATNAANSASAASTSETNAATSATNASTSATNAATSETNAAASATAAAASATDAAASASAFLASEAYTITATDTTNWDTAYGWGNHASAGYLTSETSHADVLVDGDFVSNGLLKRISAGVYGIVTDNSGNWDTAYGWGNHASAGYLTSVVGDLTPQLGGNLSTNGNDVVFGDNDKAIFGVGSDLQIYHDGVNSHIRDEGTGSLTIATNGTQINLAKSPYEQMLKAVVDGEVELYHNNLLKLATTSTGIDVTGNIVVDNASATVDLTSDAGGVGQLNFNSGVGAVKYNVSGDRIGLFTNSTEAVRIDTSGYVIVGPNLGSPAPAISNVAGIVLTREGELHASRDSNIPLQINRKTNDGAIVNFRQGGTVEGSINVSGTTVSYNGGHLARWSQLADNTRDASLVKGTVLTNLDQMAVWGDEDNEQLNCMAVSTVEGDPNVAGVFVNWDDDDEDYTNDMNIAMTGDMVIRIAQGTTVQRGDLLMSAGDGTAKPQGDDIVRSKTIAKVTSTHVSNTYADGSYVVPCVLMAC